MYMYTKACVLETMGLAYGRSYSPRTRRNAGGGRRVTGFPWPLGKRNCGTRPYQRRPFNPYPNEHVHHFTINVAEARPYGVFCIGGGGRMWSYATGFAAQLVATSTCRNVAERVPPPTGHTGCRYSVTTPVVVGERLQLVRLDALAVRLLLSQLRLVAVVPEVPQFARDLRGRDAVGVVRDQPQQEDAVVTQVRVGEEPSLRVVRHRRRRGWRGHRVHRRRTTRVVAATAAHHVAAVADAAPQVHAHEPISVQRNQRPDQPDQETTQSTTHSNQSSINRNFFKVA